MGREGGREGERGIKEGREDYAQSFSRVLGRRRISRNLGKLLLELLHLRVGVGRVPAPPTNGARNPPSNDTQRHTPSLMPGISCSPTTPTPHTSHAYRLAACLPSAQGRSRSGRCCRHRGRSQPCTRARKHAHTRTGRCRSVPMCKPGRLGLSRLSARGLQRN